MARRKKLVARLRGRVWVVKNPGLLCLTALWKLRGYSTIVAAGQKLKFTTPDQDYSMARNLRRGAYEAGFMNHLQAVIKEGYTFLDIGSYAGLYAILTARLVGPTGRVYAFEPSPVPRQSLEENIRINSLDNVTVVPYAVSDQKGVCRLFTPHSVSSRSSLKVVPSDRSPLSQEVETVRLDDFCMEHGIKPDVVKIDVEGAEAAVFAGGRKTLREARVIFLEYHPVTLERDFGIAPHDFVREMFGLGKAVYEPDANHAGEWGQELRQPVEFPRTTRLVLVERNI